MKTAKAKETIKKSLPAAPKTPERPKIDPTNPADDEKLKRSLAAKKAWERNQMTYEDREVKYLNRTSAGKLRMPTFKSMKGAK